MTSFLFIYVVVAQAADRVEWEEDDVEESDAD